MVKKKQAAEAAAISVEQNRELDENDGLRKRGEPAWYVRLTPESRSKADVLREARWETADGKAWTRRGYGNILLSSTLEEAYGIERQAKLVDSSTTVTASPAELQVREIPLELIDRSPNNKRAEPKQTDPAVIELSESIAKSGLLQPIIVRPKGQRFELVIGERRTVGSRRAAKTTGITTIKAFVRDVDDETAFAMTTLENLQREDLTVWEEAATCQGMLEHGWDVETAAAKIGKDETWVRRRAALYKMTAQWQAVCRGEAKGAALIHLGEWTPGHFELIAGLPVEEQDRMYKALIERRYNCPKTIPELRQAIGRTLMLLNKATWKLDDATIEPKAGACASCTKRSSCRPFLPSFEADEEDAAEKASPATDRCLDRACWDRKAAQAGVRRVIELKAKNPGLRVISQNTYLGSDEVKKLKRFASSTGVALHPRKYETQKAAKGAKGAYQAVEVSARSGEVGTVGWFVDRDVRGGGGGRSSGPAPVKSMQTRRKEHAARRMAWAITKLREELLPKVTWEMFVKLHDADVARSKLIQIVAENGCGGGGYSTTRKRIANVNRTARSNETDNLKQMWDEQIQKGYQSTSSLWLNLNYSTQADLPVALAEAIAELIGADWARLKKEAAAALPEPKIWAKLKADGTPKGGAPVVKGKKTPAADPDVDADDEDVDDGEEEDQTDEDA